MGSQEFVSTGYTRDVSPPESEGGTRRSTTPTPMTKLQGVPGRYTRVPFTSLSPSKQDRPLVEPAFVSVQEVVGTPRSSRTALECTRKGQGRTREDVFQWPLYLGKDFLSLDDCALTFFSFVRVTDSLFSRLSNTETLQGTMDFLPSPKLTGTGGKSVLTV